MEPEERLFSMSTIDFNLPQHSKPHPVHHHHHHGQNYYQQDDERVSRSDLHHICPYSSSHHHDHLSDKPHNVAPPFRGVRSSFWNTRCTCHFSAIPDELLLFDVFTFLDPRELCVAASVCTRWRFLSRDRLLWTSLDFSKLAPFRRVTNGPVASPEEMGVANPLPDATVNKLVTRFGHHVDRLKLCNLQAVLPLTLMQTAGIVRNLLELHLCNLPAVTDEILGGFAATCPNLEVLSLFGCISATDAGVQVSHLSFLSLSFFLSLSLSLSPLPVPRLLLRCSGY